MNLAGAKSSQLWDRIAKTFTDLIPHSPWEGMRGALSGDTSMFPFFDSCCENFSGHNLCNLLCILNTLQLNWVFILTFFQYILLYFPNVDTEEM